MEWVTLLLLVPAILLPVLLRGFMGCGFSNVVGADPPAAPTNLQALGMSRTSIGLAWENGSSYAPGIEFEVERTRYGDPPEPTFPVYGPFEDPNLSEGTRYDYRVRAVDPSATSDGEKFSAWAVASGYTLALAFDATGVAPADQTLPASRGSCFVLRIEPVRLMRGGSRVQIFLRGHSVPGFDLELNRMRISQPAVASPANPNPDPYDSHADIEVVFDPIVTVLGGTGALALSTLSYTLEADKPLLIAFDVNPTATNIQYRYPVPRTEVTTYFKIPPSAGQIIAEAMLQDRTAPYSRNPSPTQDAIYLVERIDAG